MRRAAFERHDVESFKLAKFESISSVSSGQRVYLSTSDGSLSAYEMKFPSLASKSFACNNVENIVAKKAREKHTVTNLIVAESWRVLLAIYDGAVAAFDLQPFRLPQEQPISILQETKGCSAFAIHERSSLLVVANKKKLSFYYWQGSSFALRKELMLSDAPKSLFCLAHTVVIGQKRHYEMVDVGTLEINRLLDVERDQKMLCIELLESLFRPSTVLLSSGLQGLLFDIYPTSGISDTARAYLTWSSSPTTVTVSDPYILSLLADSSVEIHDGATLISVQRIVLAGIPIGLTCYNVGSTGSSSSNNSDYIGYTGGSGSGTGAIGSSGLLGLSKRPFSSVSGVGGASSEQLILVGAGESLHVLKMVPISLQVAELVAGEMYEDALNLSLLHPNKAALSQVIPSVSTIHELHAADLLQRGEYSSAMSHYISAGSSPAAVLSLFPDFIPSSIREMVLPQLLATSAASGGRSNILSSSSASPSAYGGSNGTSSSGSEGVLPNIIALQIPAADFPKAAAAVAQFCSHHRNLTKHAADKAEATINSLRASASASSSSSSSTQKTTTFSGAGSSSGTMTNPFADDDDMERAEDAIRLAGLVDTVMLHALVQCSPPRKSGVVDLLSVRNRCHIDSSSMMLAAQGRAFTEALLWLYRSRGEHKKVLTALTEDKCVGSGGWNRDQFYRWTAEYLRWLWFSDDATLPSLALIVLKAVVEYDAELGLSILTVRPRGKVKTAFGGRGVNTQNVLKYLEACVPPPSAQNLFFAPLPPAPLPLAPSNLPPPPNPSMPWTSGSTSTNTNASSGIATSTTATAAGAAAAAGITNLSSLLTSLPAIPSLLPATLTSASSSSSAPAAGAALALSTAAADASTGVKTTGTSPQILDTGGDHSRAAQGFEIPRVLKILGDKLSTGVANTLQAPVSAPVLLLSKCEPIPLINGRSLGLAYLEWLVEGGAASPEMHDEYAQLLMEGIPFESDTDHSFNDLILREGDSESVQLYKIYRHKLQTFLQISSHYNAERLLRFLPPQFLHEYALLLSCLERHEEVLRIYVHKLRNYLLAEAFCGRIYGSQPDVAANRSSDPKNIYLLLIKVILSSSSSAAATATASSAPSSSSSSSSANKPKSAAFTTTTNLNNNSTANDTSSSSGGSSNSGGSNNSSNVDVVLALAERYHDRIESLALLSLLPEDVPLVKLQRYLAVVMEELSFKKRNLQVAHQLLRVREVDLRTAATTTAPLG